MIEFSWICVCGMTIELEKVPPEYEDFYCESCRESMQKVNKGQDVHKCGHDEIGCVQNEKSGKLIVFIKFNHFEANFCPFCGYQPERPSPEYIYFECKKCKFSARQYRSCNEGYIRCPECHEINVCDDRDT